MSICQNCKGEFAIDSNDENFYREMNVPPPTFCPRCRFLRRLMFVNQTTLYKRACALCGTEVPTTIAPEKPYTVYCGSCYRSDRWDGAIYAMDYDPTKNFFEQFRTLQQKVPISALQKDYSSTINSEYTNYVSQLKDCYLVFDAYDNDNCYDMWMSDKNRDLLDGLLSNANELVSNAVNCDMNNRVHFSEDCEACYDVYFSKNLTGCSDCFGCVNLKNAQFQIFNVPYSPEDYKNKLQEFKLSSYASTRRLKKEIQEFWARHPERFQIGQQNVNVTGEYIYNSKNVQDSYIVYGAENCRYTQIVTVLGASDCYDYTNGGGSASRIYECIMLGGGVYNMRFNVDCWADKTSNVEYSRSMTNAADCFGCVGLEKKQYCILNKQYSKKDYEKLRATIIEDMNTNPYRDAKDRVFPYGEFFPYDLSYFDYNETVAQIFFPITREIAEANGWTWRMPTPSVHQATKSAQELPDDIADVLDSVIQEIIACASCARPFRIVPGELRLLRMGKLPLPRLCFWCRNQERVGRLRSFERFERTCSKCGKSITSSIGPERPEIVYCEECYLAEVA